MTIANRIDAALQTLKMSRRQLAIKAGIPPSSFQSAMERGGSMTAKMLKSVADALGVSPTFLIGFDDGIIDPGRFADEELIDIKASAWKSYVERDNERETIAAYNDSITGKLNAAFSKLNNRGKSVALERINELALIPDYTIPED